MTLIIYNDVNIRCTMMLYVFLPKLLYTACFNRINVCNYKNLIKTHFCIVCFLSFRHTFGLSFIIQHLVQQLYHV